MSKRVVLLAVAAAMLALPAGASAGGWATVQLDSVPTGTQPGDPWNVELTILQHGVTPLEGVSPTVLVSKKGSGEQAFEAVATKEAGVYRASVVFESPGTWNYKIDDGFSQVHTYAPVAIGSGAAEEAATAAGDSQQAPPAGSGGGAQTAPASDDGPDLLLAFGVAAVAGLGAAFLTAAFRRRREGPAAA